MLLITGTKLRVVDASGARSAKCLNILKKNSSSNVDVGSTLVLSIKFHLKNRVLKSGDVIRGIIVRSNNVFRMLGGHFFNPDTNAVILLKANGDVYSKRIFSVISERLRYRGFARVLSIAEYIY